MVVLHQRTGFARTHLQAATHSARKAYEIEHENSHKGVGPWFDEMMRLVPVSVVMAGAALEANIHELLQDILDGQTSIANSRRKLLVDLKKDRSGDAPSKFRRLALLMDKDCDTGTGPWHNARLLVKFRNEFMHFRPSWDYEGIHSSGLVEELKRKVPVVASWIGAFLFPQGLMTYGCAKWAVHSVLEFCSEFTELLGMQNRFAPLEDFTLP